ncbi:NADP-dependent malic enzyme [candidate division KSB1 bacterium]|nr:NADP-dependent malic enzyme [candidate division KSB1 bacterium]MBL7094068.1 NADP-dependent malic enzyme [candidate division KSB1 bacterium]
MDFNLESLEYHSRGRKGKIEVVATKPCATQRDLSLAYTPGVAEPCRRIEKNPEDAFQYTAKGNLVAVVSNGTAVLGLGNIGALAGKPVMEGKGVLFKRFADIDVFDIELKTEDPDEIIRTVQLMEPTFGGINLEDIKAPECFYIEETLKKTCDIPIFHDDQHGTAIISGAALVNACELTNKKIGEVIIVVNGAGAAGIACADLYVLLGAKKENIIMCDSKGVIYKGRTAGMNPYKEKYASDTKARTLKEAMKGADVFCGVSVKDCVTQDMVRSMAKDPIIFAMSNPDPEITYDAAIEARPDAIMATGRSDYPNQVNNVLGFPFIFRGALDVRAKAINDEMKIAASQALANLAKEDVPDSVCKAYGVERISFGKEYIIPKPFDPRVLLWEAPAVAKAAMDTGVAKIELDMDLYKEELEARLGRSQEMMRNVINKAVREPKRVVYPEGEHDKILRAAYIVVQEKIATPILLGRPDVIKKRIQELQLDLNNVEIIDPENCEKFAAYCEEFYKMRQRKGDTMVDVKKVMAQRRFFAPMMVNMGDADGLIAGLTLHYPDTIRPALRIIKKRPEVAKVAGMYMLLFKNKIICCADTTVCINPTAEDLADIAILTAETAKRFDIEPRIAMLSFSNFGSVEHELSLKVKKATELVKQKDPNLVVDGEMQADTAVVPEIIEEDFPFSTLKNGANVLIFPDLASGNIAYKLLMRLGGAEAIGPILMGLQKSVHILQRGCEVNDIVNMTAIGVVEAQENNK